MLTDERIAQLRVLRAALIIDRAQDKVLLMAIADLLAEREELVAALGAATELIHRHHDTSRPMVTGCWCPHCMPDGKEVGLLTRVRVVWAAVEPKIVDSVTTYGAYEKPI